MSRLDEAFKRAASQRGRRVKGVEPEARAQTAEGSTAPAPWQFDADELNEPARSNSDSGTDLDLSLGRPTDLPEDGDPSTVVTSGEGPSETAIDMPPFDSSVLEKIVIGDLAPRA